MEMIIELNDYLAQMLSVDVWHDLEVASGFLLFFACLFQRIFLFSLQSKGGSAGWTITKIGQLGSWLQMMLGLLTLVDGLDLILHNFPTMNVHVLMTLWAIASVMMKAKIFETAWNYYFLKKGGIHHA
jgi:hypothetical protein